MRGISADAAYMRQRSLCFLRRRRVTYENRRFLTLSLVFRGRRGFQNTSPLREPGRFKSSGNIFWLHLASARDQEGRVGGFKFGLFGGKWRREGTLTLPSHTSSEEDLFAEGILSPGSTPLPEAPFVHAFSGHRGPVGHRPKTQFGLSRPGAAAASAEGGGLFWSLTHTPPYIS